MYHANGNLILMVESLIQIKSGIMINVDGSVKNIIYVKKIIFGILLHVVVKMVNIKQIYFFSIWVFFHENSWFTGHQGKEKSFCLTPLYHFHPLYRHLEISWAITAESSPLDIASSWTVTKNLWFPCGSC